jgi:hypothetical protein
MTDLMTLSRRLNDAQAKIAAAIVAEAALDWLKQYGPKTVPERDSIAANVSQNLASACPGAKEARKYLESAVQQFFPLINQRAIELAEQDIEAGMASLTSGQGK